MNDLLGTLKPLGMIEAVAALEHPATLAELAAHVGAPKPTVHRWLGALETAGLLQRTPDGRCFELAPRAASLAFSILTNRPSGTIRHEILHRVVGTVGEACNLTVLDGTQVTYLDRVESTWPLRITFQQGSKVPAYCSASGKLFLALMRPAKRDLILNATPLVQLTENTIVDRSALHDELAEIRANGYALDREEFMSGLVCLAVPIYQQKGRSRACVAALAIQAPVTRMEHKALLEKLPVLQKAAGELAATLTD
ncbi:IclR family transcriptional regulator [Bradyrhizobium sp. NP1]|uniref:IclR family transcriptional regulator n=1 Tax=Bradyrhizobium sp. NP1 TaxID=3049772 RepID=UPI0025A68098|nr:IclR family transcriptional regulator [Bradyrhizobium sp. NP1]WJR75883.1 IclR family transcriptional regulator [Bradyrhizobium sp. NP1]